MQTKLYPFLKHTMEDGVLDIIVPVNTECNFLLSEVSSILSVYSDLKSMITSKIRSGRGGRQCRGGSVYIVQD